MMTDEEIDQAIEEAYKPENWHYCKCGFKMNAPCDCDCHYPERWAQGNA